MRFKFRTSLMPKALRFLFTKFLTAKLHINENKNDMLNVTFYRSRSKENADDDSRIGDRKRGDASIPMIKQNENALKQLNERPESMAKVSVSFRDTVHS